MTDTYTPKLNLTLPSFDGPADERVLNVNFTKIDAAFGTVPGDMTIGEDLIVTGTLTVLGTTTLTGAATASGGLAFPANSAGAAGSVYKTAADGLSVRGATGSANDLALVNAAGALIGRNPTGTDDWVFADDVTIAGDLTVTGVTSPTTPGDLIARSAAATQVTVGAVGANPGLLFGPAGDTSLYRSAVDTLRTDDNLYVGGGVIANVGDVGGDAGSAVVRIGPFGPGSVGGMRIGADTNLYRSAADTLKTDDVLVVGALGTVAAPSLRIGTEQTGFYAQEVSGTNRQIALSVNGTYKLFVNEFQADGTTQTVFGPTNKSILPATDNTHNLGNTSQKYSVVYAVGGVLTSSVAAVKEDWRPIDPATALDVARRTAIGSFRYRGLPEQRVGFLAEDTDPLLTLDGRSADPQTTAALAIAALQELTARHEALLERVAQLEATR